MRRLSLGTLRLIFWLSLIPLLPLLTAAGAEAKEQSETPPATHARDDFLQGKLCLEKGDYQGARAHFEQALSEQETAGLRYYLGVATESQGDRAAAFSAYLRAQNLLSLAPAQDVESLVQAALDRLAPQVSFVQIVGLPEEALVQIDANEVEVRPAIVAPGRHLLRVEASGFEGYASYFESSAGQKLRVEVQLIPLGKRASSTSEVEDLRDPGRPYFVAGLGLGLSGLGVLTAGLVVAGRAQSDYQLAYERLAGGGSSSCYQVSSSECEELSDALRAKKRGRALSIAGGALLGVGVALFSTSFFVKDERTRVDARASIGAGSLWFTRQF